MVLPTKDQAEDAEEHWVERRSVRPMGLNAIPGGKAGLRFLSTIKAVGSNERIDVEDKDDRLATFLIEHPDALRTSSSEHTQHLQAPRPEMARFWSIDDNAARMITSRADRLSVEQIRNARYSAAMGLSVDEITTQIGARNREIVSRLLDGKTYGRIV